MEFSIYLLLTKLIILLFEFIIEKILGLKIKDYLKNHKLSSMKIIQYL